MARTTFIVLLVAAAMMAAAAADVNPAEPTGDCLMRCGQEIVTCAVDCGVDGSSPRCYQNCGSTELKCVQSCMGFVNRGGGGGGGGGEPLPIVYSSR